MRPVPAVPLLRALRLLLPLAVCAPAALASPTWSNADELVHLYTSNSRKSVHLQIHADGRVDGSPSQTVDSALVIKSLNPGYVTISGAKSGLYLCMDSRGKLRGSSFSDEDCTFQHTLLENDYDAYHSPRHRFLVSLGRIKKVYLPNRNPPLFSQFLTRKNEIPLDQFHTPSPQPEYPDPCEGVTVGGDNPFHPCFDFSSLDRDYNGYMVNRRFPSP